MGNAAGQGPTSLAVALVIQAGLLVFGSPTVIAAFDRRSWGFVGAIERAAAASGFTFFRARFADAFGALIQA